MVYVCLTFIIIYGIYIVINEKNLTSKIKQLEYKFEKLEFAKINFPYEKENSTEDYPELKIMSLEKKARQLKFCYQCPLYQDKVQEDAKKRVIKYEKFFDNIS